MIITGAADRAVERIRRLVFLDAAIPANGESVMDSSPGLRAFAEADKRIVDGVELVLWPGPIAQAIYGLTGEDWAWAAPKLTPHPLRTFEDKLGMRNEAPVAALPRAVINCAKTLKARGQDSDGRYAKADAIWEIDAPHDLMLTDPERVAAMLLSLV